MQLVMLAAIMVAAIIVSTGMGYIDVPAGAVVKIIFAKLSGQLEYLEAMDSVFPVVVVDVRLPRILSAAIVGGGLAISGVVFQGILLNPLADPYTLGVSAGAAFGASVAILLNVGFLGLYSVPLFAFGGAVGTLLFVIYLSSSSGGFSSNNLILSGIIVAAILSAGISLLKYIADEQVSVIIFWLMGSFGSKTWTDVGLIFLSVGIGLLIFIFFARDMNLMSLGNRTASSLGVDTRKVTLVLLVTASLVAAVCVSVSGIIGFVGLLVPHMMRLITGPDNRRLVPVSLLAGAILLLGADTVTRAVLPTEIPIGVLTALIGGPFFCYLFRKQQAARKVI
ncbi:Vitamin B12 ABC transporter, permease component BtuC [Olavius algarvensis Delta 1 endosymbiont]|nr:Vitamin B12 ABC transporter, permease component BtuC [Olavius algarvensis Delta 1 endosymbiont]